MTAEAIADAAVDLLAALGPAREASCLAFDDPERVSWHYTPRERRGISIAQMDRMQAKATHRLLASVLSPAAHARVAAIAGLEDVLDEMEGGRRGRHAGDYWTAIFGDPKRDHWGWRFEGHHVSINLTMAGELISTTPFFLGANPAVVAEEGRTVLRPLGPEEDLAYDLLASLDGGQLERAVLSHSAPSDILTGERPWTEATLGPPAGLAGADLRAEQRVRLRALAAVYPRRLTANLGGPRLSDLDRHLDAVHFAWAGDEARRPGAPHYYRIQGPRFLVELDNTQNDANHVHSVWRDPQGDFGAALV
ncbi:MAG: DUF3500 domain-containing protein [Actinomycetota bacterium]|nr:DUF3500 domain-containing protein [Actinomycetota bacterium]